MDTYRTDHKTMLDALLLEIPGVKSGKAFGYPSYTIGGRVFAFVGGAGISLKLSEARVQALIAENPAMKPFEPAEGIIWRQWVSIDREDSSDYRDDIALMEESIAFVGGAV